IWSINNGGNWSENTLNLSGTLANGAVYVIAHPSTAFLPAGVTNLSSSVQALQFNGDDAIGLAWNGGSGSNFELIDAVGTSGPDVGDGWDVAGVSEATANHILIRKPTVFQPNADWASSAGTNAEDSEWIVSGLWTGVGQTN